MSSSIVLAVNMRRGQWLPEELPELGRSAPAWPRCRPASGEALSGLPGWPTGLGRFAAAPCPGR